MERFDDFEEWFGCLNRHRVDYVVVGGYAVGHHGHPRYTADLDVWYRVDEGNVARLLEALEEFGFGSLGLKPADFLRAGNVIQLGYPPEQIDLLTRVSGLTWEEAARDRSVGTYGEAEVPYLGLRSLLKNKRATGRAKDLGDLEELDPSGAGGGL